MQQLFAAISPVIAEIGENDAVGAALTFAAWRRTAGDLISARTSPVAFVEGRLVVAVEDRTWQRHLEELAPQFLAKLNGKFGPGKVKFIEFRIEPDLINGRPAIGSGAVKLAVVPDERLAAAADKIVDVHLRKSFLDAAMAQIAKDQDRPA